MTDMTIQAVRPNPLWFGPVLVLLGGICIGFAPIGLRYGLETMGPQAIAFWRYTFAVPLVFATALFAQKRLPARPNRFVILAGICFALDIGFWHAALALTTVANATFIVNLGNIGVGLLAWIFLRERPGAIWSIAVIVALCGAGLLTFGGGVESGGNLRGDGLALIAAILVSGYMLCAKIARRNLSGLDVLFWVTVTEMVVAAFLTLLSGENFIPATLSGFVMPFFLAVVVQLAGQGLIIAGLGKTPASIAGVLILIQPVIAAGISWQLFDEMLVALQFLGGGLLLAGVFLAQRGSTNKTAITVD